MGAAHGGTSALATVALRRTAALTHWLALRSTILALRTAWMASHGTWTLLLHEIRHGLEEHLQVELELFLVSKIGPLGTLGVLLAELLEVMLVTSGFILELTNLFDLVVVDGKGFVVNRDVLLGRAGLIWLLEADESVKFLGITGRVHPQTLNFTILSEQLAKILFLHRVWESLHVQIATFLRALVLDGLTQAFSFTIGFLEGLLDVEFLIVWDGLAVDLALTIELGDGLSGALWSVLAVHLVLRVVADEGVGALVVALVVQALNAAELCKQVAHLLFSVLKGEVLGINVVVDLSEVTFVAWLVTNDLVLVGIALCC